MDKDAKTARTKQEDTMLNRAFIWVLAAIILQGLLILTDKYYVNFIADDAGIALAFAIQIAIKVITVAAVAAAVLGIVWYRKRKMSGKSGSAPLMGASLSGMVFVCGIVIWKFYDSGIALLYVLVPASAVMALIYYLYRQECFLSGGMTAVALFGLWLIRRGGAGPYADLIGMYLVVMSVVVVLAAALLWQISRKGGVLQLGKREVRILSNKANYPLLYLSAAVSALTMLATFALGSTAAYYLIFVLMAWAFVLLVYHTVRMM